jgi:hypothetical protein
MWMNLENMMLNERRPNTVWFLLSERFRKSNPQGRGRSVAARN